MFLLRAALFLSAGLALASDLPPTAFLGSSALEYTRKVVAYGPRPSGSPAIQKLQAYLRTELRQRGCTLTEDAFTATTPAGPVRMVNFIARWPGKSGKSIVFTGHYDTKRFTFPFVGANDAGSSTGVLLEMARILAKDKRQDDVYLVFFDGEEAVKNWTETDSLYGSRHLVDRWSKDGTLAKVKALINVDMIGDRDLQVVRESNSSPALRTLVWQAARDLGYARYFGDLPEAIEDDHMPFLRSGVNALDLIDFSYGPDHTYWHTEKDTFDKLGSNSLQVIGSVLVESLRRLEK